MGRRLIVGSCISDSLSFWNGRLLTQASQIARPFERPSTWLSSFRDKDSDCGRARMTCDQELAVANASDGGSLKRVDTAGRGGHRRVRIKGRFILNRTL